MDQSKLLSNILTTAVIFLLLFPSAFAEDDYVSGIDEAHKTTGLMSAVRPIERASSVSSSMKTNLYSGCCLSSGSSFCSETDTSQECCNSDNCAGLYFDGQECSSVDVCKSTYQGCCLDTCQTTSRTACPPPNRFDHENPVCSEVAECSVDKGCCVLYQGEIAQQCFPNLGNYLQYPEGIERSLCYDQNGLTAEFYGGVSGQECVSTYCSNTVKTGTIKGKVLKLGTTTAIADAYVYLKTTGEYVKTNSTGDFVMLDVPAGTRWLEAMAEGYVPKLKKNVIVYSDNITDAGDIYLEDGETEGQIKGYVKHKGDVLSGAYVSLSTDQNNGVFTDKDGFYSLKLVAGSYDLVASLSGYESETDSVTIKAGLTANHNFTLEKGTYEPPPSTETQCVENGGKCYLYDFQCEGSTSTETCEGSYKCCKGTYHSIPQCVAGIRIYENSFSYGWSQNPNMCECETGQYYDITGSGNDQRFCCQNGTTRFLSTSACTTNGDLEGFVFDGENMPVTGVSIEISQGDYNYDTTSNSMGQFAFRDIVAGYYEIKVSKYGYNTKVISGINVLANNVSRINISMEESVCEYDNIVAPQISAGNILGQKVVVLNWTHSCAEYVTGFHIYRSDNPGSPIASFDNTVFSYVDTGVSWGAYYNYYVRAASSTADDKFSSSVSASPGNAMCEEKEADDEFCTSSTYTKEGYKIYRTKCNAQNQPVLVQYGNCPLNYGSGSVCVDLENDKTACSHSVSCKDITPSINQLFGLFYEQTLCEVNASSLTGRNFCYYDKGDGIVDQCLDCKTPMTCFDYQSESACKRDNCFASGQGGCEWGGGYYEEYGSGFCYEKDYTGTDRCSLCGPNTGIFTNAHCNADVCSLLGNCYSVNDETRCAACFVGSVACEDMTDQQSCVGSDYQAFSMGSRYDESSPVFTYSHDSCKLGVCKWSGTSCYKDADDNGISDCNGARLCVVDVSPPITKLTGKPIVLNNAGFNFTFSVQDTADIEYTRYCLTKASSQSPDCTDFFEVVNKTLALPNSEYPFVNVDEDYTIWFFSKDVNSNVERINNRSFRVDTKPPVVSVSYTVENNSASDLLSNVLLDIGVSEDSICSDKLAPAYNGPSSKIISKVITEDLSLNYTNVPDSLYYYTVNCTDKNKNTATKSLYLDVDRIKQIDDLSPQNKTINTTAVTVYMTTSDKYYCEMSTNAGYVRMNTDGYGIEQGSKFYYEYALTNLENGTYYHYIRCKPSKYDSEIADSATLYFTVDQIPPVTVALRNEGSGVYSKITEEGFFVSPTIKLDCTDYVQTSPPGEFGCENTYYCTDSSMSACLASKKKYVDEFTLALSSDQTFCYFSEDSGANSEVPNCINMKYDDDSPVFNITSPTNGTIQSVPFVTIMGSAYDKSGPYRLKVEVSKADGSNATAFTETLSGTGTTKSFSKPVDLFPGMNKLNIIVEDAFGHSSSKVLYVNYVIGINISIGTEHYTSEGVPVVTKGRNSTKYYNISLAAGDIFNLTYFGYEVFSGANLPVDLTKYLSINTEDSKTTATGRMFVPTTNLEFDGLEGKNTRFVIRGYDKSGNKIDSTHILDGRYFSIDTFGGNEVTLTPAFSSPHYTIYDKIDLTGFSSPRVENMKVVVENNAFNILTGDAFYNIYETTTNIDSDEIASAEVLQATASTSKTIRLKGNTANTFAQGRYVELPSLSPNSRRYKVVSSSFDESNYATNVVLEKGIHISLSEGDNLSVYSTEASKGWFSLKMPLVLGYNDLTIYTVDEFGNEGTKKNIRIVSDNVDIDFMSVSPYNTTVTANENIPVEIYAYDRISGVNSGSLKLKVDGGHELTCGGPVICAEEGLKLRIYYKPASAFSLGVHNFELTVSDKSGNENTINWWVEVLEGTVSDPGFVFENARNLYNLWYQNSTQIVAYVFFDEGDFEDLTSYSAKIYDRDYPVTVEKINSTAYKLTASNIPDGNYALGFEGSIRIDSTHQFIGKWFGQFVVDTKAPRVIIKQHDSTNNLHIRLLGNYFDPNMDENAAILLSGDLSSQPVVNVLANRTYFSDVNLVSGSDGYRTINVEGYDLAGNKGQNTTQVMYDTQCSYFTVTGISDNTGSGIVKNNEDFYLSNIDDTDGVLLVGSSPEVVDVRIYLGSNPDPIKVHSGVNGQGQLAFTLMNEGDNNITVSPIDKAQNTGCDTKLRIVRDSQGPVATLKVIS